MSRVEFVFRRLLLSILVLIGVSLITFAIARVIPSDPAQVWVGPRAKPEQVEAAREKLGLDRPLYEQYLQYMGQVLSGDLGISVRSHRAISEDVKVFLPATLELVFVGMALSVLIGIPLGVLSGARKGSWIDHVCRIYAVVGVSLPVYWVALLLQLLLVRELGLLPLGGRVSRDISLFFPVERVTGFYLLDSAFTGNWRAFWDTLVHLLLPSVVLSSYGIGLSIRMTRANILEVLEQKYITAAWAAGLGPSTIYFKLALKNAIVPTLLVLGLTLVWQLTGAMLVEIIFMWPGLGTYLMNATLNIDFPVVVSVTMIVTVFYVLVNLAIDILQAAIDPRVRLE